MNINKFKVSENTVQRLKEFNKVIVRYVPFFLVLAKKRRIAVIELYRTLSGDVHASVDRAITSLKDCVAYEEKLLDRIKLHMTDARILLKYIYNPAMSFLSGEKIASVLSVSPKKFRLNNFLKHHWTELRNLFIDFESYLENSEKRLILEKKLINGGASGLLDKRHPLRLLWREDLRIFEDFKHHLRTLQKLKSSLKEDSGSLFKVASAGAFIDIIYFVGFNSNSGESGWMALGGFLFFLIAMFNLGVGLSAALPEEEELDEILSKLYELKI